jgi:hypothetical protein
MKKVIMELRTALLILVTGLSIPSSIMAGVALPGFRTSPWFEEQVTTFRWNPDMRIQINAPSAEAFDPAKPVGLALFALPNGNSIEQTVGKILQTGDDWHYDIQHIGAQTRFLREKITDYNLVVVYLEADQKSWPAWNSTYPDHAEIIKSLVEYLKSCFKNYQPFVVLTGHSGGGRFIFSFMDAFTDIPDYVERICFLDSDYGYENSYGDQLIHWLNGSDQRFLSVLAYNDSVALYNGEPIVSPTGGTWYRSRMMQKYLAGTYTFATTEDDEFIRHEALNGRIKILLKKNPEQKILHTVQVELNGFIHTMVTGTSLEEDGYTYYGPRSYSDLIQNGELVPERVQIPLRSNDAITGEGFMQYVMNMSFADREDAILHELVTGNIPYFIRDLTTIQTTANDANGNSHQIEYRVMPIYLAIGSDSNFCRIPMGPITAQRAADFYGTSLPTPKMVDEIYLNAEVKLAPVTYTPVGSENEKVYKFVEHNTAIEAEFMDAGGQPGQLTGGTKKDVVLSNKITDPTRPDHVVIYGWHQLNGEPIQPVTNIHINTYVDYSHGIRMLDMQILFDGSFKNIRDILKDPVLYSTLSNETGAMAQPTYITDETLPGKPGSFGLKCDQDAQLKLEIDPEPNIDVYHLYLSRDGLHFDPPVSFTGNTFTIMDLPVDSIVYVKLTAENGGGISIESEVLAALPRSSGERKMLIVNGFDRPSAGNTYNFIRQHGAAVVAGGGTFESATNDAVISGLFRLTDYPVVDYILGDESTADESFSASEQTLVAAFLKSGGRLFVSGAEIAWDLDYKGSTGDKSFLYNFLKAQYSADAPGGVSGTYYSAEGVAGSILDGLTTIDFDNGTHGTINVRYADALKPINGSEAIAEYKNVSLHNIGGVSYQGMFPNGTAPGKLVYLGFPFETVYPEAVRNQLMSDVMDFLYSEVNQAEEIASGIPDNFALAQNYPNPFNPSTTIPFLLPRTSDVTITIFNQLGARIRGWRLTAQPPGRHNLIWNGTNDNGAQVSSGTYFCRMDAGLFHASRKLVLVR